MFNFFRRFKNTKLSRISKLLRRFEENYVDDDAVEHFVGEVHSLMDRKKAGKVLTLALEAPDFFKLGPLLFCRKIANMVADSVKQENGQNASQIATKSQPSTEIGKYIYDLDKVIREDPFQLGFSSVSCF